MMLYLSITHQSMEYNSHVGGAIVCGKDVTTLGYEFRVMMEYVHPCCGTSNESLICTCNVNDDL
jgi:hypothetical protein